MMLTTNERTNDRRLACEQEEEEEDGGTVDVDAQRKGKAVVLKTTTRQTIFLPVIGLVDGDKLKPADLVGVNKDSYLILDTLPAGREHVQCAHVRDC